MNTMNGDEEINYWTIYIKNELTANKELFAEFEISGRKTYNYEPIVFSNGHKLKEISKRTLLDIIVNIMETNYQDKKYFITTRTKDDSSHYYITLTIIQN